RYRLRRTPGPRRTAERAPTGRGRLRTRGRSEAPARSTARPLGLLQVDPMYPAFRIRRGPLRANRTHERADLSSQPDLFLNVDTRLDRQTDSGDQGTGVPRFEVVDVRPRAVQLAVDRVPRSMDEHIPQAPLRQDPASRV